MVGKPDECIVCRKQYGLHRHHIIFGTAGREMSEKYDITCMLCYEHHEGDSGVHHNDTLNEWLKKQGQKEFERQYGHEKYMEVFGKNYLD